jgi:dipeptidyl aminopeptidase/acylaminoacyl peptidase
MPATGGKPRELRRDASNHVWDPSGKRLYYVRQDPLGGTRLESVEIDGRSGKLRSSPHTVSLMTGVLRDLAIARDGQQLVVTELRESLNLTRLPLAPGGGAPAGAEEQLSIGQVQDNFPSFSPDGRRIALASNRSGISRLRWPIPEDHKLSRVSPFHRRADAFARRPLARLLP